uniref:Uncharacterized protein n=1 Tax=Romanomermis culicivorax TaxID=13658 RepID=A0A915IRW8_ROMCU
KSSPVTVQEKCVKISNIVQNSSSVVVNREINSNFDQQDDFADDQESMKIYVVEGNSKKSAENSRINTQFLTDSSTNSTRIVNEDAIMPLMPRSEPGSKQATTGLPTPMMYSRHSSMQSLDSCDHYSINSNVASEYSQLPTGQQSPSDVPDSPTQQMPPAVFGETAAVGPSVLAAGVVAPSTVFNQILMANDSYCYTRSNNYRRDVTQNDVIVDAAFDADGQCYDLESLRAYKQEEQDGSVITEFSGLTTESEKIKPLGRKLAPAPPANILGVKFSAASVLPRPTVFAWSTPPIRAPAGQLLMFRPRAANGSVVNYPPNVRASMKPNANDSPNIAPPPLAIQNLIRLGLQKQNGQIRSYK